MKVTVVAVCVIVVRVVSVLEVPVLVAVRVVPVLVLVVLEMLAVVVLIVAVVVLLLKVVVEVKVGLQRKSKVTCCGVLTQRPEPNMGRQLQPAVASQRAGSSMIKRQDHVVMFPPINARSSSL